MCIMAVDITQKEMERNEERQKVVQNSREHLYLPKCQVTKYYHPLKFKK